jgi:hypothetical protein
MGASGNTGLPHTQASSLSLTHTFSRFQASVACGVFIKILLKYYPQKSSKSKKITKVKNTVNKYMADLRPDRLTTYQSERKLVISRRSGVL